MNLLSAHLKEVLDDLRVIKSDFVHEINEIMETIYDLRSKVDRIVSERSFLHRREESEQLAFEATKGSYHDQLERNGIIGRTNISGHLGEQSVDSE